MLKKTITYTNFNDETVTEDFYFNFTKAELQERELMTRGGFENFVKSIVDAKDMVELTKLFTDIVLAAYGEKSADGKRFYKSKEISNSFHNSEAYSVLFMELLQDEKSAQDFIIGILPPDLREAVTKGLASGDINKFIESNVAK